MSIVKRPSTVELRMEEQILTFLYGYKLLRCPKRDSCELETDLCFFYHSEDDRRRDPFDIHYSSDKCRTGYGDPKNCRTREKNCQCSHNKYELKWHPNEYKTRQCRRFSINRKSCIGMGCHNYHFDFEKRKKTCGVPLSDTALRQRILRNGTIPVDFALWQEFMINKHREKEAKKLKEELPLVLQPSIVVDHSAEHNDDDGHPPNDIADGPMDPGGRAVVDYPGQPHHAYHYAHAHDHDHDHLSDNELVMPGMIVAKEEEEAADGSDGGVLATLGDHQRKVLLSFKVLPCEDISKCDSKLKRAVCFGYHNSEDRRRCPFDCCDVNSSPVYLFQPCANIYDHSHKRFIYGDDRICCSEGDSCLFSHSFHEMWYHPCVFKQTPCPFENARKKQNPLFVQGCLKMKSAVQSGLPYTHNLCCHWHSEEERRYSAKEQSSQ